MTSYLFIEVAVTSNISTSARGAILEKLATRLLLTQNYAVDQQLRLTGMEVDLLARDRDTGQRVIVECKAHRSSIAAEVLSKILGTVEFRKVESGWLIATYTLSKDAKGMLHEWEQRPPSERNKLRVYDPDRLIRRLVAANLIVDPLTLQVGAEMRPGKEAYLLLTETKEYWAVPTLDQETGIQTSACVFDAQTGEAITSNAALAHLASTDASISGLIEEAAQRANRRGIDVKNELQSIVSVPVADNWADYRPARPGDFVGRDDPQKKIFDFFDQVRERQSRTRLFAIKGPSGWGKSSLVLKLAARSRNIRNKNKTFVFSCDARAATSRRFGELALIAAFRDAYRCHFLTEPVDFSFGGAANPFSTESMESSLAQLQNEGKIICVIFDQFEELLYQVELESAFQQLNHLCNAVDEAQANVVVGFSWKTDGTIPTEHKAYHLWHNYSDRRLEVELTPFDTREVTIALNHFSRLLKEPLAPQLRRLLHDHCQGYPWLLKKLCIHVFELVSAGHDQADILDRSLSVEQLFRKDIQNLTAAEFACIKQIAEEAPAEYFRMVDVYGDGVINSLFVKRLLVRSGARLNIYWDIFRDYIITDRAPFIPGNYVPHSAVSTYLRALHHLLGVSRTSFDELSSGLQVTKGTVGNVARDLVMVGHADVDRRAEVITCLQKTEEEAAQRLHDFCRTHIAYRGLMNSVGLGEAFSVDAFDHMLRSVMRGDLSDALVEGYRQKLMRWFQTAALLEKRGSLYFLRQSGTLKRLDDPENRNYIRAGASVFLADAPPSRVVSALETARSGRLSREKLELAHGRNTVRVLSALDLVDANCRPHPSEQGSGTSEKLVRIAASKSVTIAFVREFLSNAGDVSGSEIGSAVADEFGIEWSKGSMQRTGSALRVWVNWLDDKPQVGRRGKKKRLIDPATIIRPLADISAEAEASVKRVRAGRKLSPEQKVEIVERWVAGYTMRQLAEAYGVSIPTISRIASVISKLK